MNPGRPKLAMIAALTDERVIGRGIEIPFRYPEDMKHFRTVTAGHAVIMGRTTFDSIGKPLKGRRNIVVSRNTDLKIEGAEVAHDLWAAIALARSQMLTGDWRNERKTIERINALTPKDVHAYAQKYLGKLQVVLLGDPTKLDKKIATSF